MIVGSRIKSARKALGLTQKELGEKLNLSKPTICCYEKETRGINIDTLIKLTEVLGVTADYLLVIDTYVESKNDNKIKTMTNEEIKFIEELRKDDIVYEILFNDPIRGANLVKKKIG